MKIEVWTLAIVGTQTGDEPWTEIHRTAADALASVVNGYGEYLSRYADDDDVRLLDDASVADMLADYVTFTIEPAVIDTDDFTS